MNLHWVREVKGGQIFNPFHYLFIYSFSPAQCQVRLIQVKLFWGHNQHLSAVSPVSSVFVVLRVGNRSAVQQKRKMISPSKKLITAEKQCAIVFYQINCQHEQWRRKKTVIVGYDQDLFKQYTQLLHNEKNRKITFILQRQGTSLTVSYLDEVLLLNGNICCSTGVQELTQDAHS